MKLKLELKPGLFQFQSNLFWLSFSKKRFILLNEIENKTTKIHNFSSSRHFYLMLLTLNFHSSIKNALDYPVKTGTRNLSHQNPSKPSPRRHQAIMKAEGQKHKANFFKENEVLYSSATPRGFY
ncbi:hypothetical protein BpHYR1_048259, partial [Brachionus plicatilis]